MKEWKAYLLLSCFGIQAVVNLAFYGFPSIMFSVIVPRGVRGAVAMLLPFLIAGYFSLAVISIYYLGISPKRNMRLGRTLGVGYFFVGLIGSSAVLLNLEEVETPLLPAMMLVWALTSLIGALLLALTEVRLPSRLSVPLAVLLVLSGLISIFTAEWLAEDYSVHAHINESISENASVVTSHPIQMPPPNATNTPG